MLTPDRLGGLILTTAIATLYGVVGIVSLLAALRLRVARAPAALVAWAMLQHAVDTMAGSGMVQAATGWPVPIFTWVSLVTGYFIAVPWAMLLEQLIGRGWRSSIRLTWVAYLLSASASVAFDLAARHPRAAAGANAQVIAAGAFVGFANLFLLGPGRSPVAGSRLKVLRAGFLVFMALVVHDGLASSGLLPWRRGAGPVGVLIFVGAIGYTVVTATLRAQRELGDIEHELVTARRIQASLLPSAAPPLAGAAIAFRYVPAAAVAGDLFDFLPAGPRAAGVLVADVSGHGVPAALIASMVKVAAAAQKRHAHDPAAVLAGIHLALADELPHGHFVTAAYAYIDLDAGLIRHASAGHPPPIVWHARNRSFSEDGATGALIISFAPADYPVGEVRLTPGDRVLLYTDGVVEAMRGDGEMFGVDRVRALIAASAAGPDRLASDVMQAAARFTGRTDGSFEDDCTLVALEVGPP